MIHEHEGIPTLEKFMEFVKSKNNNDRLFKSIIWRCAQRESFN